MRKTPSGSIMSAPLAFAFVPVTCTARSADTPDGIHWMPICCAVMRFMMSSTDVLVSNPPKGVGAALTVVYPLPR